MLELKRGSQCSSWWNIPGRGGATTHTRTRQVRGRTSLHILARRLDAQGAVISDTQASPGGVCKGGNEGAKGLEGSLAHLKPQRKSSAAEARLMAGTDRWLIPRQPPNWVCTDSFLPRSVPKFQKNNYYFSTQNKQKFGPIMCFLFF